MKIARRKFSAIAAKTGYNSDRRRRKYGPVFSSGIFHLIFGGIIILESLKYEL
jgi:hypothetical protein